MFFKNNNKEFKVDVLYGYQVIVDRGITYSRSIDGSYGYIDRNINSITTVITVQGEYNTMNELDKYVRTIDSFPLALEAGEHIFGPEYWYRSTTEEKVYYTCPLKHIGKLTRKNLKQYTLQLSLVKPSVVKKDPQYDLTYTPSWNTDIRYESGYTTSLNHDIRSNDLLDGTTAVSTSHPLDYTVKFKCEMTNKERAQWNNSLISGANRNNNRVLVDDMFMNLFGYNEYSTLHFFVKSFTFSNTSFNSWACEFELLLDKQLSE